MHHSDTVILPFIWLLMHPMRGGGSGNYSLWIPCCLCTSYRILQKLVTHDLKNSLRPLISSTMILLFTYSTNKFTMDALFNFNEPDAKLVCKSWMSSTAVEPINSPARYHCLITVWIKYVPIFSGWFVLYLKTLFHFNSLPTLCLVIVTKLKIILWSSILHIMMMSILLSLLIFRLHNDKAHMPLV